MRNLSTPGSGPGRLVLIRGAVFQTAGFLIHAGRHDPQFEEQGIFNISLTRKKSK